MSLLFSCGTRGSRQLLPMNMVVIMESVIKQVNQDYPRLCLTLKSYVELEVPIGHPQPGPVIRSHPPQPVTHRQIAALRTRCDCSQKVTSAFILRITLLRLENALPQIQANFRVLLEQPGKHLRDGCFEDHSLTT